jgi:hypothetical protein
MLKRPENVVHIERFPYQDMVQNGAAHIAIACEGDDSIIVTDADGSQYLQHRQAFFVRAGVNMKDKSQSEAEMVGNFVSYDIAMKDGKLLGVMPSVGRTVARMGFTSAPVNPKAVAAAKFRARAFDFATNCPALSNYFYALAKGCAAKWGDSGPDALDRYAVEVLQQGADHDGLWQQVRSNMLDSRTNGLALWIARKQGIEARAALETCSTVEFVDPDDNDLNFRCIGPWVDKFHPGNDWLENFIL